MKKIERNDWFTVGLSLLEREGFSKITIDNLCNLLKVTKGSFYHHFGNIEGYIKALMEYWLQENTMHYIEKANNMHTPQEKYKLISEMVIQSSYKAEQVIRAWSFSHPIVKEHVKQADKIRLAYIAELRIQGGEKIKRARQGAILEYAVLIGMQQLFPHMPQKELKEIYNLYNLNFIFPQK